MPPRSTPPGSSHTGHTALLIHMQVGALLCVCLFNRGFSHWIQGTRENSTGKVSLWSTLLSPGLEHMEQHMNSTLPQVLAQHWHVGLLGMWMMG